VQLPVLGEPADVSWTGRERLQLHVLDRPPEPVRVGDTTALGREQLHLLRVQRGEHEHRRPRIELIRLLLGGVRFRRGALLRPDRREELRHQVAIRAWLPVADAARDDDADAFLRTLDGTCHVEERSAQLKPFEAPLVHGIQEQPASAGPFAPSGKCGSTVLGFDRAHKRTGGDVLDWSEPS